MDLRTHGTSTDRSDRANDGRPMQLPDSPGDPRNEDERTVVVVLYNEETHQQYSAHSGQVIEPGYVTADENWFLNHPNKWWRLRDPYKGEIDASARDSAGSLQKEILELVRIHEQTDPSENLRFKILVSVFEPTYAYMVMLGREDFNDFAHLRLGRDGAFTPVDVEGILREITKARATIPRNAYGFWNGLSRNCCVCQKAFSSGELVVTMVDPTTKLLTKEDAHLNCGKHVAGKRVNPSIFLQDIYRSSHIRKWPSGVRNRFARSVEALKYLESLRSAGLSDEELAAVRDGRDSQTAMGMLIEIAERLILGK